MKHLIVFEKTFNAGHIFEGATIVDSLSFVSTESRDRWIDGVRKHEKRNGWRLGEWWQYPPSFGKKEAENDFRAWKI